MTGQTVSHDTVKKTTLGAIGTTAETIFILMASLEVAAQNQALLDKPGIVLGWGYIIIQTYFSSVNYYLDCFCDDEVKKTTRGRFTFRAITLVVSIIIILYLFISNLSFGLLLYDFSFLNSPYAIYLTYGGSVGAALIQAFAMFYHTDYNLKKVVKTPEVKKSQAKQRMTISTKIRWVISLFNVGFLLAKYYNWRGFLMGVVLALLDIYDSAVFLASLPDSSKDPSLGIDANCYANQGEFEAFKWRYIVASGFNIGYTAFLVYTKLIFFGGCFMNIPAWVILIYSGITASMGVLAKAIRNYQTFQNIKQTAVIYDKKEEAFFPEIELAPIQTARV